MRSRRKMSVGGSPTCSTASGYESSTAMDCCGHRSTAKDIGVLRAYMRHRQMLIEYAAAHVQHMQKALPQMNLQLQHVISDITGSTGMKIIRPIVAGERKALSFA